MLVIKQSEAALSHITLAVPFLVSTFCTCRRHVSMLELLQTFAEAIGTLSIDDEKDDDDELRRERTGSRTSFTAGKFET